jgi:hypothetical protein
MNWMADFLLLLSEMRRTRIGPIPQSILLGTTQHGETTPDLSQACAWTGGSGSIETIGMIGSVSGSSSGADRPGHAVLPQR